MAKHRIRRWVQFSVLDLLMLTFIVAVMLLLYRPLQGTISSSTPWVFGRWDGPNGWLWLFPDGSSTGLVDSDVDGAGWKLHKADGIQGAFVLTCQGRRFVIRHESGRDVMDVLNEDETVQWQLEQTWSLDGPMHRGIPDGTWEVSRPDGHAVLKYQSGELVDFQWRHRRRLSELNFLRKLRGLSRLSAEDFKPE